MLACMCDALLRYSIIHFNLLGFFYFNLEALDNKIYVGGCVFICVHMFIQGDLLVASGY